MSPTRPLLTTLLLSSLAVAAPAPAAAADELPDFYAFRDAFVRGDPSEIRSMLESYEQAGEPLPLDDGGTTLLHRAIHVYGPNKPAIIDLLVARGIDPDTPGKDARTPMHFAAMFDCAPCATKLLEHGAKVSPSDVEGLTPLHLSSANVAPVLLAAGADLRAVDASGNVPLHRNYQERFLPAGINVRNRAGLTPLHFAALSGNLEGIDWLIARGADPTAKTTATTNYRSLSMSREFGPGDAIAVGSTPLDLAKMQEKATRWTTSRYQPVVARLKQATREYGMRH